MRKGIAANIVLLMVLYSTLIFTTSADFIDRHIHTEKPKQEIQDTDKESLCYKSVIESK